MHGGTTGMAMPLWKAILKLLCCTKLKWTEAAFTDLSHNPKSGLQTILSTRLTIPPPIELPIMDASAVHAAQIFPENTGLKLQRRAYIVWDEGGPRSALLVKKSGDRAAAAMLEEIGKW